MAFDEGLAQRVRERFVDLEGIAEKQMFGGLSFLLHGNMACGIIEDDLIVRVGKNNYQEALTLEGAGPFDMTGRPMSGWVTVAQEVLAEEDRLDEWVQRGVATAQSLPPK